MRYFSFVGTETDNPTHLISLQDLARALSGDLDLRVQYGTHSLYERDRQVVTVGGDWGADQAASERCRTADVYLRAYGSARHTDAGSLSAHLRAQHRFPSFTKQLCALAEDVRLEAICVHERPGMRRAFISRREALDDQFRSVAQVYHQNGQTAELFLIGLFHEANPFPTEEAALCPEDVRRILQPLRSEVLRWPLCPSTKDVLDSCMVCLRHLELYLWHDARAVLFETSEQNGADIPFDTDTFSWMTRTQQLEDSQALNENQQVREDSREQMEVWQDESKSGAEAGFQMNLERGGHTAHAGGPWREGVDEIESMTVVQGHSQSMSKEGSQNDTPPDQTTQQGTDATEGTEPRSSKEPEQVWLPPSPASERDVSQYQRMHQEVSGGQAALCRAIRLVLLEHRRRSKRNLPYGRLSRRLTKVALRDFSELFYHKTEDVRDWDVSFVLLVDCSGSMYERFPETKRTLVLIHEAFRELGISHAVVGHWEDVSTHGGRQPVTHFQTVVSFDACLQKNSGLPIAQLSTHLDNRDGSAIRAMTELLLSRTEQRRFLLVFSDADPAAENYGEDGVADTYQAVMEAKRKGISVLNIDIAPTDAGENDLQANWIYGWQHVSFGSVDSFVEDAATFLKKLLQRSVIRGT